MIARRARGGTRIAALCAALLASCAAPGTRGTGPATEPNVREITATVLVPQAIDLTDRGVVTLAVLVTDAPGAAELGRSLAAELASAGPFEVLDLQASIDRLTRVGVSIPWEASRAALRAAAERGCIDAVVIGRLERFELEENDKADETVAPKGTGVYGFVMNDEGKIAYREKIEYERVPLYCRSDRGTVAASYRVWDTRAAEAVATVRHEFSAEVSSFCYRGDLPEGVKRAAQERLLQKLFRDLNRQFVADVVPARGSARLAFEVLPQGADAAALRENELGLLLASQGDWKRAIDVWRDSLQVRPALAATHYNLARAYQALGRRTLALEYLERAAALDARPFYRQALTEMRSPPPAPPPIR